MKKIILIWLVLHYVLLSASNVDSLFTQLDKTEGESRLEILLELSSNLKKKEPEKAIKYAK